MIPPLQPPFLSFEDINSNAESFLRTHNVDDILPVPIEKVVEFNLKIDIIPFPNLQRTFDGEGFISSDLKSIYVDDYIYTNRPTRYYFTLAHEIGHFVLHKDLITSIRPKSISAWKDFVLQVDDEDYGWLESHAYTFGGLLLVPRKFLFKHFSEQLKALEHKIEKVKSKNLPRDSYQEHVIEAVSIKLADIFCVSIGVIRRRISKEIQKGTLNIP